MPTLYDKVKQSQEQSRVKPVAPVRTTSRLAIPLSQTLLTPDKPRGFLKTTIKTASKAAVPAVKRYMESEETKRAGMTLGERFQHDIIKKPSSIVKFLAQGVVSIPLALGRSGQEFVADKPIQTPTALEWEKKIFGTEVESYQELTRNIQGMIDMSPDSTEGEKKFLAPLIGLGLFASDAFPGKPSSKTFTKKFFADIAADTEASSIERKLIQQGIEQRSASRLAPNLAKETNVKAIKNIVIKDTAQQVSKIVDTGKFDEPTTSLFERVKEKAVAKVTPGKLAEDLPPARKISAEPNLPVQTVKRVEAKEGAADGPFFRSEDGKFVEIQDKDVLPAPIRDDLDTFIVREGDEFMVVEGKSGRVIGKVSPTIPDAIASAKKTITEFGDAFETTIARAELSPRYTKTVEPVNPKKSLEYKMDHRPEKGLDVIQVAKGRGGFIQATEGKKGPIFNESREALLKLKEASPDTKVTVYRSSPMNELNSGDWITLSPGYAEFMASMKVDGSKSNKFTVLAKEIRYAGVDITEFGYFPEKVKTPPKIKRDTTADKIKKKPAEVETPIKENAATEVQSYELLAEQQEGSEFVTRVKTSESEEVADNLRAIFADMRGVELDDPKLKFSEEDLFKIETEYEFIMDSLIDDPARALSKYTNKFGELPEVTGTEFVGSKTGDGKRIKNSTFGRRGDDIVTELGFDDSEQAIEAFGKYAKRRDEAKDILTNLKNVREGIRLAKGMDAFVGKNQRMLARELTTNRKAMSNLVAAAEKAGFRRGFKTGEKKYQILVDTLRDRRQRIRGIKWAYNLTDTELLKLRRQQITTAKGEKRFVDADPRFMEKEEFNEYLANIEVQAEDLQQRKASQTIIKAIIEQKDLKKTENLREAMQLPPLSQMNQEELGRYEKVLSKLAEGDELLTKRTLEVIDRTALKGARTTREVREFLSLEIKRTLGRDVKPSELDNLTAGAMDYLRYDTALAESKPFYGFIVNKAQTHMMAGESNYLRVQDRVNELAIKANKSRKKGIKQKISDTFIPRNPKIIRFLEARGEEKDLFAKALTKEELEYATFIRNYYNSAYNYMSYIQEINGSRYIDAYFTHVRKGFLEKWSDDGFVDAIKNMWDAQKEDMAIANIIDSDTGRILPKSKFFQFALKRTGEGEVSQNLTGTFLRYAKLMERKKMLDKMVPELDVYTQSLTPKQLTDKGLEMDRTMKEFVNNYLNTKRGRRFNFGGIVKQNGPADILMRAGNTLVSVGDLGFNFLAGSAALVGETVANYVALGKRGTLLGMKRRVWDTGMKRLYDPKAAAILKQAEPFIGRNLWTELMEVDKPVFEKGMQVMFGMFSQSSVESNKIFLLGRMTKAELKAGRISPERMAELKLDAGRWRDMGADVKSIVGATSPGGAYTKYKGWALPIFRTTVKNITEISSMLKKGDFKTAITAKQTKELMREIEVTTAALIVGSVLLAEDMDDGPLAKLRDKVKRESLTLLGGVDPEVFLATPRLYSWLQQLASNLKEIVQLEEYKTDSKYGKEGSLKGIGGLKRQFTPGFLRQFIKGESKGTGDVGDLDKLGNLGNLDKLDNLDNLDNLDRLDNLDAL